jgi:rhodanese-related sulfurtransferase
MMNFLQKIFGSKVDYAELVNNGAVIIDVRTPAEFSAGHIKGAINIPVDKIGNQIEKIKKYEKPVITCCRSGARSGMAASTLKAKGVEAYNGGPWDSLKNKIKK